MHTLFNINDDKSPEEKANTLGIQPLPNGSILVEMADTGTLPFREMNLNEEEVLPWIATRPFHTMFYAEGHVYHAASGFSQRVTRPSLKNILVS